MDNRVTLFKKSETLKTGLKFCNLAHPENIWQQVLMIQFYIFMNIKMKSIF